jgi:hypothetical protein
VRARQESRRRSGLSDVGLRQQLLNKAKKDFVFVKCPFGGGAMYQHQLSRRMQELAQRPRLSIRGTEAARERARRAASARWQRARDGKPKPVVPMGGTANNHAK